MKIKDMCLNGCGSPAKLGEKFCDAICAQGYSNRMFNELMKRNKESNNNV